MSDWSNRFLLLTLAILLGAAHARADAPAAIGDAVFETIESNDAIVDGVVTALAQDSRGFLWIGTPAGLVRYDGYRMRRFRNDSSDAASLGDDFVRDLLPAADGGMWVATATGGLSLFDPRTERFRQFRHRAEQADSLAHDGVLALARDPDRAAAIWVGTVSGLDRYDGAGEGFVHYRHAPDDATTIAHDTVRSLLIDRRGTLWVGTRSGLSRRAAGAQVFEQVGALASSYVYTLFEASDGKVWVGTQAAGACWIDPQDGSAHWLALGEAEGGLSHPWITHFAEPRPGQLWLGTYGAGIDVVDVAGGGGKDPVIRRVRRDASIASSLALDQVTALGVDRSGLVWVGSWGGGLQRYNPTASAFHTLHYSPTRSGALSDPTVLSVLERADGKLWIGTAGKGIDVVDRARGVVAGYRPDKAKPGALRDGTVSALAQSADGAVWVGTRQAGLLRFDPRDETFRQIAGASASFDTRVSSLLASRSGKLWVTAESGLAEFDPADETARRIAMEDGAAFGLPVSDMIEDRAGRLWVGTARGLLVMEPGAAGLRWVEQSGRVQSVLMDDAQNLWVFGQGVPLRAPAAGAELPRLAAFALDDAWGDRLRPKGLVADTDGRLWAQNLVVDPQRRRAIEFGRAEGVDVGAATDARPVRTRDGVLLFGGTRGLLMVDAQRYEPWRFEAPVVVTAIEVDGLARPIDGAAQGVTLAAGARRVSVEFAALDYSAPLRNRYRYRLEGNDAAWIETDAEHRVATYSNLWPGAYALLLDGSNRAGDWSPQVVRIPLRVLPAWWQTAWFAVLALVLLALLVYGAYKQRTARIRRRARELADLVEQRSAELNAANRHLVETQQRLAVQEKMAALGSLVAGVAHEASSPLGVAMTALSGIAESWTRLRGAVASGRLARPALNRLLNDGDEYTQLAIQNTDRVAALVSNLKAVVARRDSDRAEAIDLAVHLREAATLISGDLQGRGHRIEVDVPDELMVTTVPDALTEVLSRALVNVLDHAFAADGGGVVRISARRLDDGRVEIEIADNGSGISAEALPQVFEPFFTTRRGANGRVGLGLHVAYNHVVQRLKGAIEVRSEPGRGTRVVIDLPSVRP